MRQHLTFLQNMDTATTISPAEQTRYEELQQQAIDLARQGETETLAVMLSAGMPVNLQDQKGNSLLMLATYNGNLETAQLLLERGASVDLRNDRYQTPLGGVAFKGYTEIASLLLEYGADVNADNGGGKTPLLFATMFGRLKVRKLLKANGGRYWRR